MLKLKTVHVATKKISNESDYYIKIKLLFEDRESLDGVCYWNAYGEDDSLVQIGLSNPTGAIYKIVVFFHDSLRFFVDSTTTIIQTNASQKIGLPLFETYREKYREGYYHLDEKISFKIYLDKASTTILISSALVVLNVTNDLVTFGFDVDNNLCYIHLKNMVLNSEDFLEDVQ